MRKPRRKTGRKGFAPTPKELARRRTEGYAPAATLARENDVSASCVYNWASRWLGDGMTVGDKPAAFKHLGHLWVLEAAVKARTADPVPA